MQFSVFLKKFNLKKDDVDPEEANNKKFSLNETPE